MKQLALIYLSIFFVVACKMDVEYCEIPHSHSHKARVQFCFDWAEKYIQRPQYMDVKAERVVMHNFYKFETTTFPTGNDSTLIKDSPDPEDMLEFVNPADSFHHVLHLRAGEYNFLAYNGEREDVRISGDTISESITDDLNTFGDVYAGWRDRNPYSGYLVTADTLHLFRATANLNIPLDISDDRLFYVTLRPQSITQVVNINFSMIPKESGIVVEDVTCCMSGACRAMLLSTAAVCYQDTTYKVLYKPTFSSTSEYRDTLSVKGRIRVPGIVSNRSASAHTGPGVLQVNIRICYTDGQGTIQRRILEGSINLQQTLHKTPSLCIDEDGRYAVQTSPVITLDIEDIMQLTHEKIESVPGINIDKWVDHTPIGVDF